MTFLKNCLQRYYNDFISIVSDFLIFIFNNSGQDLKQIMRQGFQLLLEHQLKSENRIKAQLDKVLTCKRQDDEMLQMTSLASIEKKYGMPMPMDNYVQFMEFENLLKSDRTFYGEVVSIIYLTYIFLVFLS